MVSRILTGLLFPLTYTLGLITPKRRDLWLFSAWFGYRYEDSPRAVFEECHRSQKGRIAAYWIYKGDRPSSEHISPTYFVHCFSPQGVWLQLRARVFVLCINSLDFMFGVISVRNVVVQTWHGTPMKAIGYPLLPRRSFSKCRFWIRRYLTDNYTLVLSPKPFTDKVFARAFMIPENRLFRCAYPRCDMQFLDGVTVKMIRRELFSAGDQDFVWLYLPTHRNEGKDARGTREMLKDVISALKETRNPGHRLFFKPHFYESRHFDHADPSDYGNASYLDSLGRYSLYEALGAVDGLITDYSSVAYDFEVTGKPIVLFNKDIEDFRRQNRELLRLPQDDFPRCAMSVKEVARQMDAGAKRDMRSVVGTGNSSLEVVDEVRRRLEF